jgi:tetratricopeptide (TPR) repeat protein
MIFLGWAFLERGDYKQAEKRMLECYQFSKRHSNRTMQSFALDKLGMVADAMGEYPKALRYHQEALVIHKEHELRPGQGFALSRMSLSAWGMGEYEDARQYACEAYQIFKYIGHPWGMSSSLCRIGFAELGLENIQAAQDSFYKGLIMSLEFNYVYIGIYNLIGFGSLYATQKNYNRAAELLSLAIHHPATPASQKDIAQAELAKLEQKLSPEDLADATEKGRNSDYQTIAEEILSTITGDNNLPSASA